MTIPRLVAFDLDGTLAPSKSAVPTLVANGIDVLSARTDVAVISGGSWHQFSTQLLPSVLPRSSLFTMPTSGAMCRQGTGLGWTTLWDDGIPAPERSAIVSALGLVAREVLVPASTRRGQPPVPHPCWGPLVEDRGAQVTLSLLGQEAPVAEKEAWALKNQHVLERALDRARLMMPTLSVRRGGTTSIDVSLPGWDKARGIARLLEHLGLTVADVFYVGDRLGPGGNDRPVRDMGAHCVETSGPDQTLEIIRGLLGS